MKIRYECDEVLKDLSPVFSMLAREKYFPSFPSEIDNIENSEICNLFRYDQHIFMVTKCCLERVIYENSERPQRADDLNASKNC